MVCLLCGFKILLTVFNQSYNCLSSHYLVPRQKPTAKIYPDTPLPGHRYHNQMYMKPIDISVIRGREKKNEKFAKVIWFAQKLGFFIYFVDHSFISMNLIYFIDIKNLWGKDRRRQLLSHVNLIRACKKVLYQLVYVGKKFLFLLKNLCIW